MSDRLLIPVVRYRFLRRRSDRLSTKLCLMSLNLRTVRVRTLLTERFLSLLSAKTMSRYAKLIMCSILAVSVTATSYLPV